MRAIANAKRTAIAATMISILPAVAWGDEVVHYGRAGGAVGTDRLQELHAVQRPYQAMQPQSSSPQRYGRAGVPVGADVTMGGSNPPRASALESTRHPTLYGRSGVPLPFGG